LVLSSDAQSSANQSEQGGQRHEFQYPTGLRGPVGVFGLLTQRYRHLHNLKDQALARLAVTQRNHAILNDNACDKLRTPLTEQDYLKSKYVSEPLRMLDSVMVCDGANAVLITTAENARRLGLTKAVFPTAYAEITNYKAFDSQAEIIESGFSMVGPKALAQAGMTTRDIRMFHPYDDFLIAILLQLEQIGFCGAGDGSDFILDTDMSFKGRLPLNTGGGQISAGQPGLAGGGVNLVEAVRQMFGEGGARQVADTRNAMVTGIGVIPIGRNWSTSGVLILEQ
jgi:acetyl-CoA acetyltransferase